jgi:surface protein
MMFFGCKELILLPDISKWDVKNIKSMAYCFFGCKSLACIPDISRWKVDNCYYFTQLFYGCECLLYLPSFNKWNAKYNSKNDDIITKCISLVYSPGMYHLSPYYLRVGRIDFMKRVTDLNLDTLIQNNLINLICRLC